MTTTGEARKPMARGLFLWPVVILGISAPVLGAAFLLHQRTLARDTSATPLIWGVILGVPALSLGSFILIVAAIVLFARKRPGDGAAMLGTSFLALVLAGVSVYLWLAGGDWGPLFRG